MVGQLKALYKTTSVDLDMMPQNLQKDYVALFSFAGIILNLLKIILLIKNMFQRSYLKKVCDFKG